MLIILNLDICIEVDKTNIIETTNCSQYLIDLINLMQEMYIMLYHVFISSPYEGRL